MVSGNTAVRVEGLSKRYRIGLKREIHDSLLGTVVSMLKSPLSNYRKYRSLYKFDDNPSPEVDTSDILWALKDVSFDVSSGEVLGIIGRNGAGKSTLLKILSRITFPTKGYCEIHGRVSSLLEVGTGFHQELTGRENIYLNATILGMKKREVDRKFDEIVAFSGVEKFIDTPVKRYSSGMAVRLAFSVAAHLDPEILIIDEVLAVGDASFQRKCMNKMEDVKKRGRTILFVSHNMPAITRICQRVILLDEGGIVADGSPHEVTSTYLSAGTGSTAVKEWPDPLKAPCGEFARLRAVRVKTEDGVVSEAMDIRRPVDIEIEFDVLKSGQIMLPHFVLRDQEGSGYFIAVDVDPEWRRRSRPVGRYISRGRIPGNLLSEGTMFVGVALLTLDPVMPQFDERDLVGFQVIDTMDGDSARGDYLGPMGGVVRPLLNWQTEYNPNGAGSLT
jgi:lipopolysaccharide transport system ATP-binding protein